MKKLLLPLLVLLGASQSFARPSADRLGICYSFKNGTLAGRAPCVISAGYGAGAQYLTLSFGDKEYYAEFPNLKPNMPPTLNDKLALEYQRDTSFLNVLKGRPIDGEDYMPCIKTKDGKTDLCYLTKG